MSVTATVKWYNTQKGFGFVSPMDGRADIFMHSSVLATAGLRTVRQGATIQCEVGPSKRGEQVTKLLHVDESTAGSAPAHQGAAVNGNLGPAIEGQVKFFDIEKGFGFGLADDDGPDVFIGALALKAANITSLQTGMRVRMWVKPGKRGRVAEKVEILR